MEQQNKPATQVPVKHKELQSVNEFSDLLAQIATKLKEEGQFIIVQGDEQVIVQPSQQLKVEYEYKVKGDKHTFEIEFEWYPGDGATKKIRID